MDAPISPVIDPDALLDLVVGVCVWIPPSAMWRELATDQAIIVFVRDLCRLVFKYGGRIILVEHPAVSPVAVHAATRARGKGSTPRSLLTLIDAADEPLMSTDGAVEPAATLLGADPEVVRCIRRGVGPLHADVKVRAAIKAADLWIAVGPTFLDDDGGGPREEVLEVAASAGIPRVCVAGHGAPADHARQRGTAIVDWENGLSAAQNLALFDTSDIELSLGGLFAHVLRMAERKADLPASVSRPVESLRDLSREMLLAETRRKLGLDVSPVQIGDYVLQRRLGAGGLGEVWLAVQPEFNQRVAIKIVRQRGEQSDALAAQIRQEATAMAQINHSNVATIHTIGAIDGWPYIVMEYVDGRTLTRWIAEEEVSEGQLIATYALLARALDSVHRAKVIHGDFKQDNVIVAWDGGLKIVDFGMAISGGDGDGLIGGTPEYMAPEQLDRERPRLLAASDQYALCVALYEDLLGTHPYVGQSYEQFAATIRASDPRITPDAVQAAYVTTISNNHKRRHVPRPERLDRLPGWLREALLRGLDPDPARRFASMEALAEALEWPQRRAKRRETRIQWAVGATACAALVGVGLGIAHSTGLLWGAGIDPCEGVGAGVERAWNEGVRGELSATVSYLLEPYASEWSAVRREICEATFVRGAVSGATHEARVGCLERRLDEAKVAIKALKDGGEVSAAAGVLSPPASCALLEKPANEAPVLERPAVARARAQLTSIVADEIAEDFKAGLAKAEAAIDEAKRIGYEPLLAEALYQRARIALLWANKSGVDEGKRELGERSLEQAIVHAARTDDALYFNATIFQLRAAAVMGKGASAEDEAFLAVTLPIDSLDEAGRAALDDARALNTYRRALSLNGEAQDEQLLEAIALYRRAIEAYHAREDAYSEAKALENLGDAIVGRVRVHELGERDKVLLREALAEFQRAEDLWRGELEDDSGGLTSLYPRQVQARYYLAEDEEGPKLCDDAQSWIRGRPKSSTLLLAQAKIDLVCAQALWGDPRRSMEYALQALNGPLGDERRSALDIVALLRPELLNARDIPPETLKGLLDRAENALRDAAGGDRGESPPEGP